jgi:hypothetical protein
VAVGTTGCSAFEGLTVADRGGDSGPDPSSDAATCVLAHPPLPAAVSMAGTPVDFTVAVSELDLGDALDAGTPPYLSFGYDLDNACTSQNAGSSCVEPTWAATPRVDGPGGRDNAVGRDLYNANVENGGLASATQLANSSKESGVLQLAIRVRNYNQRSVSAAVEVDYFGVTFHAGGDGGSQSPRWDGTDAWDVYNTWLAADDGGAFDIDRPAYRDTSAYVTNTVAPEDGTPAAILVSHVDRLLVGGAPPFHLARVVMTAEVAKVDGAWVLRNGTFAGRVPIDDLLHSLTFARDTYTTQPFCQDAGSYAIAKIVTCAYADISYLGPDDSSRPCDGASWAWQFPASVPISLAGIGPALPVPEPPPCGAGLSPAEDRCTD